MDSQSNMREFLKGALSFDDTTYYNDGNIHYSLLSKVDYDQRQLSAEFESTEAMSLGTAFDLCMESVDKFKSTYKASSIPRPSNTLGLLADILIASGNIGSLSRDNVNKLCDEHELWKSTKGANRHDKLVELWNKPELINYLREQLLLSQTAPEFILEFSQYNDILVKSKKLLDHIKRVCNFEETDTVGFIWQPIYRYTLQGHDISVKFDLLVVNYTQKLIYPFDMKYYASGKTVYAWPAQFRAFRYDIQATLYTLGLVDLVDTFEEKTGESWSYSYFRFGIACPNDDRTMIYTTQGLQTHFSLYGYTTVTGYRVKGIIELIDLYKWHTSNEIFEHSKEFYDSGEQLKLELPITLNHNLKNG